MLSKLQSGRFLQTLVVFIKYELWLQYYVSITNFEKSRTSKMSPTKKMGKKPVQSSWLSPKATNKNRQRALSLDTGAKYLVLSPLVPSKREKYISFAQIVYFLREQCLLFNFWMIRSTIMSKKDMIVNFIIPKLKSKLTSLKKYTDWAKLVHFSLVLREREDKKPNISHHSSDWTFGLDRYYKRR